MQNSGSLCSYRIIEPLGNKNGFQTMLGHLSPGHKPTEFILVLHLNEFVRLNVLAGCNV